jgi:hypothetical protein
MAISLERYIPGGEWSLLENENKCPNVQSGYWKKAEWKSKCVLEWNGGGVIRGLNFGINVY